jgi:hypothetical protein
MKPSDPDATPWGHRDRSCVVHGWGCPNQVAPAQGLSSSSHQGEEEGREEEEADERRITVVIGPVGVPTIHRTARITIGPRGQPQGPLAPRTKPSPPTSPTLAAPPPALPSIEAGPSGYGTSPDLLSPCSNRVLQWFTRFTAPSSNGRVPGS